MRTQKMTLEKAFEAFLNVHKPQTATAYKYPIRDFVRWVGASRDLDDVTAVHVAEWGNEIGKRNYKVATYNKYIKAVRTWWNWLVKVGFTADTPTKVLKLRKQGREVRKDAAMSDKDLERVLDYVKWRCRDFALLCFLADTGARAGGASGLKWGDINFVTREASLTEKGNKRRTVAFGERCKVALLAWQERQKHPSEFVFSTRGKAVALQASSISKIVMRACEIVGVKVRGAHSLRHRKGFQFADAKIAPSVAKTALGHESVVTTLTHYYPDDWDRAKSALDTLSLGVLT